MRPVPAGGSRPTTPANGTSPRRTARSHCAGSAKLGQPEHIVRPLDHHGELVVILPTRDSRAVGVDIGCGMIAVRTPSAGTPGLIPGSMGTRS